LSSLAACQYSIEYNSTVYTIQRTEQFADWLDGLKDRVTRARLVRRLEKAQHGNLGDVKPVGDGVFEMREFFGPGWRMYYVQRGTVLIVMLGGGDKSTQQADIVTAQVLAATIEE
jgi:putative addiction module killer protein